MNWPAQQEWLRQYFVFEPATYGLPFNAPMDKNTFAFCNYFVAMPSFWNSYFAFVDKVITLLDQEVAKGSEVRVIFAGTGSYHRDGNITMKPFVIERLFSTFIQHHQFKVASFNYGKNFYEVKFGGKFGEFLFQLSALKNTALN